MFEFYCLLTGGLILFFATAAYIRTRDALHPAIVLSPLFLFMNSVWPILLNRDGALTAVLSESALEKAALLYLVTLACFYLGFMSHLKPQAWNSTGAIGIMRYQPSQSQSSRLFTVSILFGLISVAAFWYMIGNAGGFSEAYSQAKGGGHAPSGYIGEATLLSYPAILFLALSKRGSRYLSPAVIFLALLFASPHILQGTFGGRRGPLFLVLFVLFFAWHIARTGELTVKRTMVAIGTIGLLVIFVWSQRQHVYLGSGESIESARLAEVVAPDVVVSGNTYVNSVLAITTADYFQNHHWGYRYFVTFFIRPIPKQLWPSKYRDVGADWLFASGAEERNETYTEATGLPWVSGSAIPAIADGYVEFSWGVVILFYFTGRLISYAWWQRIQRGGFWELAYLLMVMLGVYLATQSYTAWAHRLLFIGLPTALVWRYWIAPDSSPRHARVRQPRALGTSGRER